MTYFGRLLPALGFSVLIAAASAACAPSSATTRPAAAPKDAEVLAAHGYAMPRDQLVGQIREVLQESGWALESGDDEVGVFVAKRHKMMEPAFTLTIVLRPAGERVRVDVTSTATHPELLKSGLNERNVWAFYDGLDRRAGE